MKRPPLTFRQWVGWTGLALIGLLTLAVWVWRGDILRAGLDPQVPFQTYTPPPAPDYSRASSWALQDAGIPGGGTAPVFFLAPTTYDGGRHWNGPIDDSPARHFLERVVLPNYAAPFAKAGPVSAPLYRQASLYTRLSLREDAREARAFAYRDVATAFESWLARHPQGPLVLVGVEQGGELMDRLLRDRVAPDRTLRSRIAAVYLIDVVTPAEEPARGLRLCSSEVLTNCVVAYAPFAEADEMGVARRLRRALTWDARGRLVGLEGRAVACVNPVTGSVDQPSAPARRMIGATNATGLEWGARPALMARTVDTACRSGVLRYERPSQESLREAGSWADRRKVRPYNLFYGDLEADVVRRIASWTASAAPADRRSAGDQPRSPA